MNEKVLSLYSRLRKVHVAGRILITVNMVLVLLIFGSIFVVSDFGSRGEFARVLFALFVVLAVSLAITLVVFDILTTYQMKISILEAERVHLSKRVDQAIQFYAYLIEMFGPQEAIFRLRYVHRLAEENGHELPEIAELMLQELEESGVLTEAEENRVRQKFIHKNMEIFRENVNI